MSALRDKERIDSILQAARLRGLAEPDPGVDSDGNFTLTWLACVTEIVVSFTPGIYVVVLYP